MRSQILSLAAIALMLSACAGNGSGDRAVTNHQLGDDYGDRRTSVSSASYHRPTAEPPEQYHHEPTPEEEYAGQIALLISAQIFACAFVVVILDGSCEFFVGFGHSHI